MQVVRLSLGIMSDPFRRDMTWTDTYYISLSDSSGKLATVQHQQERLTPDQEARYPPQSRRDHRY